MFETHDEAEVPIPPVFGDPGLRMWSYVKCRLHVPWFHVVCRFTYEDKADEEAHALREMMFLTQVEQLLQLQEGGPRIQIEEIDLMTPGHMNGTDRWKLEPLAEVWEGIEPETDGQRTLVYVLDNGTRYVDSALDTPESELIDKHRVVQMNKTAGTRKK